MEPETAFPSLSSEFLMQEGLHTAPCCLTSNRRQGAEAGRERPLPLPTSSQGLPPRKAEHRQVPFAHQMVLCRTCCMADTVFSQATYGEDIDTEWGLSISEQRAASSISSLSHQGAGLTVPHTHTGHSWASTGLTAGQPPQRCFCISLYLEGAP